ncbi:MAG: DUF5684 domain-containing protein [Patescibacteria group bacterium]
MDETMPEVDPYMDDVMDEMPVMDNYMEVTPISSELDGAAVASIAGLFGIWFIFVFGITILMVVAMWKMFNKANQPGWAAIIPFYNFYIMLKIAGRPGWWMLMLFIPIVNIVFMIIVWNDISKAFGKGVGFTLGLIFLGVIFLPILGFGSAEYIGEGGEDDNTDTPPQDPNMNQPPPQQEQPPQDSTM